MAGEVSITDFESSGSHRRGFDTYWEAIQIACGRSPLERNAYRIGRTSDIIKQLLII